ncbi:MAG: hypothetical protein PHC98_02100 [Syntrophotalea acetylenica]|jgi:hypothetical protein|uniref:Uncharacterized protein n=2 Tax=Syntrophotalea TaxID=2812025 RepID=A0A1L3GJ66_SYNAC|nr:hypothetical protein [Syntrophotalea acetylenica]APG25976.1 hypothetical protein A7E75_13895 [Syntrophotalea acetylenica]APG44043.1 hypothetical protein A6070_07920 [Syntrophotalea acetylenica]MDD4456359.1 hypothetical protein [Syntrophotalea acetylenica]MDY0263253.1 hypothetical protein [Syntrophotalea acetylenica]
MKIYFLVIRARPVPGNPNYRVVPGVSARFWVMEQSSSGALHRALYFLKCKGYVAIGVEQPAIPAGAAMHAWSENEMAGYQRARNFGISMFLT